MSSQGLLHDLSVEPPENLLDSKDPDQAMDKDENDPSANSSAKSSPDLPSVPIKNYASIDEKRNEEKRGIEDEDVLTAESKTSEDDEKHKTPRKKKVESITPVLRRSSRANKGIGKEIFDPSYIPAAKKKFVEPIRFDSPNTDHSASSLSSSQTSPALKKKRIVVGRSPLRRVMKTTKKSKSNKKKTEKVSKKDASSNKKKPTQTPEPKKVMSKADFSDDDDNVPLKKLKEEESTTQDDDDGSSSSSSSDGDSSDVDSDDSYNNPMRLWCICRKPHNNRFMISCDQCEDWFHGDCVGISLERGKKMEENNEEYVCPTCSKTIRNDGDVAYEPPAIPDVKKERRKSADNSVPTKPAQRSVALDKKLKSRKTLKGYANDHSAVKKKQPSPDLTTFPNNKTSSEEPSTNSTEAKKNSSNDEKTSARKCIVKTCNNDALPGSVYCSNQCILKHAKESLMSVVKDKAKTEAKSKLPEKDESSKPKALNPNRRISVICRKTRKVLTGPAAPRRKDLSAFLKKHPTYKVFRPHPPSSEQQDKAQVKTSKDGSTSSADFYKHVASQHWKRDRYAADSEHTQLAKKVADASLEKKHRVIKQASLSASSSHKSSNYSDSSKQIVHKTNPYKMESSGNKLHKQKNNSDTSKKHESGKLSERRESKEHKRKHSDAGREEKAVKKVERSPSSSGKLKQDKPSSTDIRQNIKKSLFDILKKRSENSEDLKMHPDSIMRLAGKVEDSLFRVYNETNMKYKNKYRSMMFNLKDPRNHGLWRKVIIGEVTTAEFVQMTAEQMASKKLAEWRKNELTQELDIIQKQEKEKSNIRPVAKITHKGEIAIQEDLSDMTENFSRDTTSAPTIAPTRKKRISLSEDDPLDNSNLPQSHDTTAQHNEHLFDMNCKICTGKLKEEDMDQSEAPAEVVKKVKRSTSIILSTEAQIANSGVENIVPTSSSAVLPTSHIVISEQSRSEKKKKKKKSHKDVESNINSHDPSLSPTSFLSKLTKEKSKKPVLPSPPPLSDIPEREAESATKVESKTPKEEVKVEPKTKEEPLTPPKPATPVSPDPPARATKSKLIWSGSISMLELSTFRANVYPVNGCCDNLDIDLPVKLMLGGRIHPKVVWDYLGKISVLPTKQLSVVRFHAASDDDRVGYVAMLSYFSSRKRFGVLSNQDRMLVKDMYLLPLLESSAIPDELEFCSPGIKDALTSNRPSMLVGIIVRQISAKPLKSVVDLPSQSEQRSAAEKISFQQPNDGDEEYIPDDDPPIKESTSPAPLLTDEELAAKSNTKPQSSGSLLERNRSLAPSLRFFMRKQSEDEQMRKEAEATLEDDDDQAPYSPGEEIEKEPANDDVEYDPEEGIEQEEEEEEEEPYDPEKEYEEQQEYDPETAFAPVSPKKEEDAPYDPEDAEDLINDSIETSEVQELVEKQAFIERMKRELEEKKAKLAQVEQSLQHTPSPPVVEKPRIVDPRLARRAAQASEKSATETSAPAPEASKPTPNPPETAPNPSAAVPTPKSDPPNPLPVSDSKPTTGETVSPAQPVDPLQTILSVLNMAQQKSNPGTDSVAGALKVFQKQSTPPPLPDSTTKSDAEDVEASEKKESIVGEQAPSPGSRHGDDDVEKKKSKKSDRKRHRSSSLSSSSSHDSGRRRHRHDHDDKRHSKRHRRSRSRSRSPRHRARHHRRHDRSWSRDRRR